MRCGARDKVVQLPDRQITGLSERIENQAFLRGQALPWVISLPRTHAAFLEGFHPGAPQPGLAQNQPAAHKRGQHRFGKILPESRAQLRRAKAVPTEHLKHTPFRCARRGVPHGGPA